MRHHNIKSILVTVGPKQVAKVASELWGFDSYYGSDYEVIDGAFTGQIRQYIKSENKVDCLKDYCQKEKIKAVESIAVGDGSTDIPLFNYCQKSIALNANEKAKRAATHSIDTDNLLDILAFII